MCRYVNECIDSVSSELLVLKKISQTDVFWGGFAFNVKTFGCCSHIKRGDRSWLSLSVLAVGEVVPPVQGQPVSPAGKVPGQCSAACA